MRVLFFTFEYPPLGGGVATASQALLGELSKHQDIKIDVITAGWIGQKPLSSDQVQAREYALHRLPVYLNKQQAERGPGILQVILFVILAFCLGLIFRLKHSYNLIHVFGFPSAILGLFLSWNIPYVVSLRGVDVPGYNLKFNFWHKLTIPLTKISWQGASAIITNSQNLKDLAHQTYPKAKIKVIKNGVDTSLFVPVPERQKLKDFTVTAGGTLLNSKKALGDLIAGFALFEQHKRAVKLVLVGEGQMRSKLETQVDQLSIRNRVKFLGRRSRQWLAEYLPKTHVCCLPSLSESMSNALLEAMACGLPLIVTPASKELIRGNGEVVEYRSPQQIARVLDRLYADSKLRRSQGKQSRLMAEKISWHQVAKDYRKIYDKLTGSNQVINLK